MSEQLEEFMRPAPPVTHIHEHRAPTDESMRLVREMEEKVRGEILSAGTIKNTKLDIQWATVRNPKDFWVIQCHCRLMVNGEEMHLHFPVEEQICGDKLKLVREIHHNITTKIAELITIQLFQESTDMQYIAQKMSERTMI